MMLEADRFAHPVLREFYKEKDVVMEERRMRENQPTDDSTKNFRPSPTWLIRTARRHRPHERLAESQPPEAEAFFQAIMARAT